MTAAWHEKCSMEKRAPGLPGTRSGQISRADGGRHQRRVLVRDYGSGACSSRLEGSNLQKADSVSVCYAGLIVRAVACDPIR